MSFNWASSKWCHDFLQFLNYFFCIVLGASSQCRQLELVSSSYLHLVSSFVVLPFLLLLFLFQSETASLQPTVHYPELWKRGVPVLRGSSWLLDTCIAGGWVGNLMYKMLSPSHSFTGQNRYSAAMCLVVYLALEIQQGTKQTISLP